MRAIYPISNFVCGVIIIIDCILAISVWHVYFQLFPINQQSPETAPSPAVATTKCSESSSSSQCHDPDCIFEEVNRLCNEKTFVVVPAFDTRDAKLAFEAVAGAEEGLHLCNPTISV